MKNYLRILFNFPRQFLKDINRNFSCTRRISKQPSFPREIVIPNSKPFIIDKLRPHHRDDIVPFLEWAYTQEPNAVSLNYPALREQRDPVFMRDIREYSEMYADGAVNSAECLTVVALDSEGKFAGFAMGEVERLPLGVTKLEFKHTSGRDIAYTSPFIKNVTKFMNDINDGIDFSSYLTPARAELVRKRNPPEILLAEMSMMAVRPELRKHGLGGKLISATFELVASTGCDLIQNMPTTPFSYREVLKLGFVLVRKMDWPYGGLVPGHSPVTWYNMLMPL
jgi:GNAT superfamily N-acetyltransferase